MSSRSLRILANDRVHDRQVARKKTPSIVQTPRIVTLCEVQDYGGFVSDL